MTYFFKGGADGLIDVFANGCSVVRVKRYLGYDDTLRGYVKFKIGQYRDRITRETTVRITRACVSTNLADCEPSLQSIPAE